MLTEVGGSFEIIIKFFSYLCANDRVDHQRYSIPLQSPVGLTKNCLVLCKMSTLACWDWPNGDGDSVEPIYLIAAAFVPTLLVTSHTDKIWAAS